MQEAMRAFRVVGARGVSLHLVRSGRRSVVMARIATARISTTILEPGFVVMVCACFNHRMVGGMYLTDKRQDWIDRQPQYQQPQQAGAQ